MTHRGNGNYELIRFDKHRWEVLAKTRAIKEDYIENHTLSPEYLDLNNDGILDIQLTGKARFVYYDVKMPISIRQQFIWNPRNQQFVEDKKARIGKEWFAKIGESSVE